MRVLAWMIGVAACVAVVACRGESPIPSVGACDELRQVLCRHAPTQCEAIGQALRGVEPIQVPACESTMSSVASIDAVTLEQRVTSWRVVVEQAHASSPAIAKAVAIAAMDAIGSEGRLRSGDEALAESPGMFAAGFSDCIVRVEPSRILVESPPPSSYAITGDEAALEDRLRTMVRDRKLRAEAAGEEFDSAVRLHVAADTSYAAVWSVMGVASKAGFREFRLATRQGAALREVAVALVSDAEPAGAIVLRIAAGGVSIEPDATALDDAALGRALGQRKQADPAQCQSIVRPSGTTPWREVVRTLDRARGPACDERALLDESFRTQCGFWQHWLAAPR